jgi:hypothetical protein
MAIGDASGSPQGVVVFFGGGRGTGFSGTSNQDAMTAMLEDLHREGLATVRVAWKSPWLFSAPGEQIGPRPLGCRPATMVKWVHDNLYQQIGADPALGECGLCIVGDSGGASQVVYPLVDYGLDSMIDTAVPISGPVHTGLAAGCLHDDSGDRALWYSAGFSAPIIDGAYGFFNGGPCQSHDPSWAERWEADSIDAAGRDFHFPNTRVVILFGSKDGSSGPPHGELFFDRLRSAETPFASVETVQGMGHLFSNSPQGLEAVRNVLLGSA